MSISSELSKLSHPLFEELRTYQDIGFYASTPELHRENLFNLIKKHRANHNENNAKEDIMAPKTIDKNLSLFQNAISFLAMENHNLKAISLRQIMSDEKPEQTSHLSALQLSNPDILSTLLDEQFNIKNVHIKTGLLRLLNYIPCGISFNATNTPHSSKDYYDLSKYQLPPTYFPLCYSIIVCVNDFKKPWKNLKNTIIGFTKFCRADYISSNEYSSYEDCYSYWLNILFPDELYGLLSIIDKIPETQQYPLLRHNVSYLHPLLCNNIFLTPTGCNFFYRTIRERIESSISEKKIYANLNIEDIYQLQQEIQEYEADCYSKLNIK